MNRTNLKKGGRQLIIKQLKIPLLVRKEEALFSRIPSDHQKRAEIWSDLQKGWTGYRGEQQLWYHLGFLSEKDYFVFHNIRLQVMDKVCQMDVLIVTPTVLIIIESKNFGGDLFYDQHTKRLIQRYQNQEKSFPDPIMQAKRQQILLQQWLELHKFKTCPVEYLISLGQSTNIIKTNGPHEIFQRILYAEQIPLKIEQIRQHYPQKTYSSYYINKLNQTLQKESTPPEIHIFNKFEIDPKEIITGIQCQRCFNMPMTRLKETWFCPTCEICSKDAHRKAITDYLLLFDRMTNKQCRDFLHLTSINVCTRLLKELELPTLGSGRHKIYYRKE
jgi:hypothetical protein